MCSICDYPIHYTKDVCENCTNAVKDGVTHRTKVKEQRVKHLLEEEKIVFTHDIIVDGGCSKKRPDFVIHTTYGAIILECDEFQHRSNSCECEIIRMKQIYLDHGIEYLLFIRYNPDKYQSPTAQVSLAMREKMLMCCIRHYQKHRPKYKLGVIYLYYDGFVEVEEEKIDAPVLGQLIILDKPKVVKSKVALESDDSDTSSVGSDVSSDDSGVDSSDESNTSSNESDASSDESNTSSNESDASSVDSSDESNTSSDESNTSSDKSSDESRNSEEPEASSNVKKLIRGVDVVDILDDP
jgi:hypothetical protein